MLYRQQRENCEIRLELDSDWGETIHDVTLQAAKHALV